MVRELLDKYAKKGQNFAIYYDNDKEKIAILEHIQSNTYVAWADRSKPLDYIPMSSTGTIEMFWEYGEFTMYVDMNKFGTPAVKVEDVYRVHEILNNDIHYPSKEALMDFLME